VSISKARQLRDFGKKPENFSKKKHFPQKTYGARALVGEAANVLHGEVQEFCLSKRSNLTLDSERDGQCRDKALYNAILATGSKRHREKMPQLPWTTRINP
jgi:hypothetical protein